jgi:tetratricopeptide (TPR) repeat protein
MSNWLSFLTISFLLATPSLARKKTVGEFLSQVQDESRGGQLKAQGDKRSTDLPNAKSNLGFSQQSKYDLNDVKPPKSSEILKSTATGDIAEYERILNKQIDELFKLTQKFKNSENRGELWLRLAELYVEKSVLIDTRKQDEFDKKVKIFNEGKSKQRPLLDLRDARELNRKAIQLYDWFLKDFPKDEKIPQALFFLGFNHFELGELEKGAQFYEKLIKSYPRSSFVGEAQFSLAEYYFENEKWVLSYNRYASLVKNKNHRLNTYSLYKAAWCLYRIGKFDQALKYLESIIRDSQRPSGDELASKRVVNKEKLENEALRDLVVFYAAEKRADDAPRYFQEITGQANVSSYIEKLAYYYVDKGNSDSARLSFKYLIEQNPTSPQAFEYQYQIVQKYFYAKNSARFRDELYGWVKNYGFESPWYLANKGNAELVQKSERLRETTVRNYILQQHQTAQNSRASFSQQSAIEGYKIYISEFPKSAQVADMQFYYGELLYDMKKYDEATNQYRWVVENGQGSKFYSKAASNIIYAAERSLPSDQEILKKIGNNTDPIPLDFSAESFIKATEWYLAKFPQGERAAELKFRRARLYYQHNQFDRANESFKKVVNEHPKTKYSEFSANLMLDIFNLKKDYIGLEKAGQELLLNPEFAQSKAGGEIRNVLEKSSFKRAQDLEKDGKVKESAQQFEAFATQNPRSELALVALFNAAINFEKSGENAKSLSLYQKLVDSSPAAGKTYGPQVYRFLAKIYQNASLFDESIKNYRLAIQASPNDPLVANFHYNIGLMADSQGRNSEAFQNYSQYLDLTKRNSDKKEAHYLIAKVAQKLNRKAMAIENFERYLAIGNIDNSRLSEVMVALTELYPKSSEDSEKYKKRLQSHFRRTKETQAGEFVTQERLRELKVSLAEFKKINLPKDPNLQKKAVEKKIEALNRINKEINEIVALNSSSAIVSSLYYLGDSNQHMAKSIVEAPLPAGLNSKEIEMNKEGIKKLAEPFQQKASEGFRLAVEKGQELEVYNQEYSSAHRIMHQIQPQNFYENEYHVFESRLVKWSVP